MNGLEKIGICLWTMFAANESPKIGGLGLTDWSPNLMLASFLFHNALIECH